MFMKLLYKPLVRYSLLFSILGANLGMMVSLFLPNQDSSSKSIVENNTQTTFNVTKAFNLEVKQEIKKTVVQKSASAEFLLTDFAINSILLSANEDMVIASDPKGGVFLSLNDSYKNYKLIEIYQKKAKFQKGLNYYWAFLNPDDEKEFKKNPNPSSTGVATNQSSNIRTTTAKKMFEEIKVKNGKYYIPQDMLYEYSDASKFASTIGVRIYNINNTISFKVIHIKASSIFNKLGIKQGDMIVKMNNLPFTSPSQPIKLFQNLKNLKQLKLTIQRQGKTKELKYEVY
ncbi:PDZ domain-containing protein [Sulfurimonas sp.]|uniref:PDZ domain-containing protein n=1 Tax=Sulfurimonas sp. TaxID=2022749 RepID=UPI003565A894